MSILDKDKIDIIGINKITDEVILTISDHLNWENELVHLEQLQDKLNTYIKFIEGGQIEIDYPTCSGKKLAIEIVSQYEFSEQGLILLEKAYPILKSIGVELRHKVLK